jgi:hypothetical protein
LIVDSHSFHCLFQELRLKIRKRRPNLSMVSRIENHTRLRLSRLEIPSSARADRQALDGCYGHGRFSFKRLSEFLRFGALSPLLIFHGSASRISLRPHLGPTERLPTQYKFFSKQHGRRLEPQTRGLSS